MDPALPAVDIVGVGANSLDTLIRIPHFPSADAKLQMLSSHLQPGGQVASAIVACQKWGLRTRYIGKVGDDAAGHLLRKELEEAGVETHLITVPNCQSQHAFILLDQSSGERTILWNRDARLDLDPSELLRGWILRARMLHIDGHPGMPAAVAARWARQAGILVSADLDNLYPGTNELLKNVDFLIASREFPFRLTGIKNLLRSLPEISSRFSCGLVASTLGSDGVLAWYQDSFHYSPAFSVEVADSTGAGDIFHAGFAYAQLQGWDVPRSIEFAAAAAALNCTAVGARSGIAPIAEIGRLVQNGKRLPPAFTADQLRRHGRPSAQLSRDC